MIQTVPDILARIVEHKRQELPDTASARRELEQRAADFCGKRRDFHAALQSRRPAIIAEIKKASPSKGVLSADFDPVRIATLYQDGGAAALSVLTEQRFFQGSLDDLDRARSACRLPVLRKDFTIDEFHVVEAAANQADAVLLIAAILTADQMRRFRELAESYGMAALVEVHSEAELGPAMDSGARLLGVNNRDLHTFAVSLETSRRLAEKIPASVLKVSESGIHTRADIDRLLDSGYQAFLVGEHLMKADDPIAAVRSLTSAVTR